MFAVVAEVVADVAALEIGFCVFCVHKRNSLVRAAVEKVDGRTGNKIERGIFQECLVQEGGFTAAAVPACFGHDVTEVPGSDLPVNLLDRVFLGIDPVIIVLQQALLEKGFHIKPQPFPFVHALDNHGNGAGDTRYTDFHGIIEGGGQVIGTTAGIDLFDGEFGVLVLEYIHHRQGGGPALGIAKENHLVTFRFPADVFEIRLDSQRHVHYAAGRAFRMHVRVDAICRCAEAYIIGDDDGVAFIGKKGLQGEGLRRAFKIGANGVVAYQDDVFDRT